MNISPELLRKKLSSHYSFEVIGTVSSELTLERTMFLKGQTTTDNSTVYILDNRESLETPQPCSGLLLSVGPPPAGFNELFAAVLIFETQVSPLTLSNDLQEFFTYYSRWDTALQAVLNSGGGVQDMLDLSAELFDNPIVLHNKSFVIFACSPAYKEYPEAQNAAALGGHISIDLETTKRDEEFNHTYSSVRASIFPAHLTGVRTLYVNIFFQGRYEYRVIVIESVRGLQPGDGPLLEHLAGYMKLALGADKTVGTVEVMTLQHILKSILAGTVSDPYYIEQKLQDYGWNREDRYFCMKLMVDYLDIQNHTISLLCNNIVALMRGSCAFEHEGSIVLYVNLTLFGGSEGEAVTRIMYYLRDNNLKGGISNAFSGVGELKLYHRQAEIALSAGLRNKPHIWFHRFRDITELFLLQSCLSQLPAGMICAPELLLLKKYDREHDTDYYHTLAVYFKNNLHHVQSAKELFIHRSTFLYRLDRIRDISGLDIEDFGSRWYLLLSMKLLDLGGDKL